jgi:hypothetical protein
MHSGQIKNYAEDVREEFISLPEAYKTLPLKNSLDDTSTDLLKYAPSVRIIKCLTESMIEINSRTDVTNNQISQVWSLILESFQTVNVTKLIQNSLFDSLIRAFL